MIDDRDAEFLRRAFAAQGPLSFLLTTDRSACMLPSYRAYRGVV